MSISQTAIKDEDKSITQSMIRMSVHPAEWDEMVTAAMILVDYKFDSGDDDEKDVHPYYIPQKRSNKKPRSKYATAAYAREAVPGLVMDSPSSSEELYISSPYYGYHHPSGLASVPAISRKDFYPSAIESNYYKHAFDGGSDEEEFYEREEDWDPYQPKKLPNFKKQKSISQLSGVSSPKKNYVKKATPRQCTYCQTTVTPMWRQYVV